MGLRRWKSWETNFPLQHQVSAKPWSFLRRWRLLQDSLWTYKRGTGRYGALHSLCHGQAQFPGRYRNGNWRDCAKVADADIYVGRQAHVLPPPKTWRGFPLSPRMDEWTDSWHLRNGRWECQAASVLRVEGFILSFPMVVWYALSF